jgi:hypothetical protein
MAAPETIVACRSPLSKARELVVGGSFAFAAVRFLADRPAIFASSKVRSPECCRANYNLLPAAAHFAYALRGEKRSEPTR